jgi:hypothetical protein
MHPTTAPRTFRAGSPDMISDGLMLALHDGHRFWPSPEYLIIPRLAGERLPLRLRR